MSNPADPHFITASFSLPSGVANFEFRGPIQFLSSDDLTAFRSYLGLTQMIVTQDSAPVAGEVVIWEDVGKVKRALSLIIDDAEETLSWSGTSVGGRKLRLDAINAVYVLGDMDATGDSTQVAVDDSAGVITLLASQGINCNAPLMCNGVVRLKGYTVATLPVGVPGDTAYATDAMAPTYGSTVVGGGAVATPVFFDGATWKVR